VPTSSDALKSVLNKVVCVVLSLEHHKMTSWLYSFAINNFMSEVMGRDECIMSLIFLFQR
jgi:hypothetical protein